MRVSCVDYSQAAGCELDAQKGHGISKFWLAAEDFCPPTRMATAVRGDLTQHVGYRFA